MEVHFTSVVASAVASSPATNCREGSGFDGVTNVKKSLVAVKLHLDKNWHCEFTVVPNCNGEARDSLKLPPGWWELATGLQLQSWCGLFGFGFHD